MRRLPSLALVLVLLLTVVLSGLSACRSNGPNLEHDFAGIVKPYSFNLAEWEVQTLAGRLVRPGDTPADTDTALVADYFKNLAELESLRYSVSQEQAFSELKTQLSQDSTRVEQILARQVSLFLAEQGLYNPLVNRLELTFPPVSFELEDALNLLVVSPRDRIERSREAFIQPDITVAQAETLESQLDAYNVSSLVIPLGGLGATYPSFVIQSSNLEYTLKSIAEEWLHQYMAFRPLGFRYVLYLTGLIEDNDIATLNETIVGVAAEEIGEQVYQQYYAAYFPPDVETPSDGSSSDFDFNAAMREIRVDVDAYLAAGEVAAAENYMAESRQMLETHGYYIRKLNQAYFAFHGSYAYSESSIDPIGEQTRAFRQASGSLKNYLETASGFTERSQITS